MIKPLNVLILTDHTGHSKENSVYALASEMKRHPQCQTLHIASRGFSINDSFFTQLNPTLYAHEVMGDLHYSEGGALISESLKAVQLEEIDFIFLRLPRPISDEFLKGLELSFPNAEFVNSPEGIIETSSKLFLLNFPSVCPPIRHCTSLEDIVAFGKEFDLVLKPLRDYGGRGIVKWSDGDIYEGKLKKSLDDYRYELEAQFEKGGYLAMKYLVNVDQGDKRILVVNGEIMASSLRLPAEGSWLCNVAQGGRSVPSEVNEHERKIIEEINPMLEHMGILIYGMDTLVDDEGNRVLSELNTLSIGGFPQAERQTGLPIIKRTVQSMFSYVSKQ